MPFFVSDTRHVKVGSVPSQLYLKSNRCVIKIVEIIIGFILCALLCGPWYGKPWYEHGCFYHDGRVGFCSGLNFVVLVVNIIVFVLNLANFSSIWQLERIYNLVGTILFLIASVLIVWHIMYYYGNNYDGVHGWLIISAILVVIMFVLFLMDVKIQHGTAPNYHAPVTATVF